MKNKVVLLLFALLSLSSCNKVKDEMVLIPAGKFIMGSDAEDSQPDEKPPHEVFLKAFYIDKFEVTNKEYHKFLKATGFKHKPKYWDMGVNNCGPNYPNHPVVGMTVKDAEAYCKWRGKRLPTEEEWEKACRGGLDGLKYPWGNVIDINLANYSSDRSSEVGDYPPNGYGLYDIVGNVREYTSTEYTGYSKEIYNDKFDKGYIVNRGGSWYSGPESLRCSNRTEAHPDSEFADRGFRCAKDAM